MWTFINDCYHMTKVTIVKNYRNTMTLRQVELSEIVQMIQEQAYEELCRQLRDIYPLVEVRQKYDAMDGLSLQRSRVVGGEQPGWF